MVKSLQFFNAGGSALQARSRHFIEAWPEFASPVGFSCRVGVVRVGLHWGYNGGCTSGYINVSLTSIKHLNMAFLTQVSWLFFLLHFHETYRAIPEKKPFIFLLYPWKFQTKQSSTPGNSTKCVRSLGNSKAKNQDPWEFHIIFSWSPMEIPHCF